MGYVRDPDDLTTWCQSEIHTACESDWCDCTCHDEPDDQTDFLRQMLVGCTRVAIASLAIGWGIQELIGDLLPESCPPLAWVSARLAGLVAGLALAHWVARGIAVPEVGRDAA